MFDTVLAKAGELTRLAAELAAAVNAEMSGTEALEMLQEATAASRQLELVQCLTTERVDRSGIWSRDGAGSTRSFLKTELDESGPWVNQRIVVGRALVDELPATREQWHLGTLGMDKARVIAGAVEYLDDELTAGIDKVLAETAPLVTLSKLRVLAETVRQQSAPEPAADKDLQKRLRERVTLSDTLDGYRLSGWLSPENGAILARALEHFTSKPPPADLAKETSEPVLSPAARRAQGLIEMARQAMSREESGAITVARPTIVVTLAHDDLRFGYGTAEVQDAQPIPARAVQRMACEADLTLLKLDRDGSPLKMGRRVRTATVAQRLALAFRDKGCRFTGCDAKVAWCHVHHGDEWQAHHGDTDVDRMFLVCTHHHHLLHEGGWTWTGEPNGQLQFHPPQGPPHRC